MAPTRYEAVVTRNKAYVAPKRPLRIIYKKTRKSFLTKGATTLLYVFRGKRDLGNFLVCCFLNFRTVQTSF